jgi:hypothetical protein
MKRKIALIALLTALFSFSPKQEDVKSSTQEKKVKIELTVTGLNTVLTALQDRPMKEVGGLVLDIIQQAEPQLKDTTSTKKK